MDLGSTETGNFIQMAGNCTKTKTKLESETEFNRKISSQIRLYVKIFLLGIRGSMKHLKLYFLMGLKRV